MTKREGKSASAAVKDILLSNPDGLREVIRAVLQEVLETEMEEALRTAKGERRQGEEPEPARGRGEEAGKRGERRAPDRRHLSSGRHRSK